MTVTESSPKNRSFSTYDYTDICKVTNLFEWNIFAISVNSSSPTEPVHSLKACNQFPVLTQGIPVQHRQQDKQQQC